MTLKSLFSKSHLIGGILMRSLWLPTLSSIIFFFSLPVSTLLCIQGSISPDSTPERISEVIQSIHRVNNGVTVAIFIFLSLVAGLFAMHYMNKKQQVDFYHALPLSRERLFVSHFTAGVGDILLPFLINLALSVLIVILSGYMGYLRIGMIGEYLLFHVLGFLSIYSFVILVACLSGSTPVHVFLTAMAFGFVPMLIGLREVMMERFYEAYNARVSSMDDILFNSSPMARYIFEAANNASGNKSSMAYTILYFALSSAICIVCAALLYHYRGSEKAGQALAFTRSHGLIKYPLVFLCTMAFGLFFEAIGGSIGWLIFGCACGLFLSSSILEMVFAFDFRCALHHWRGTVVFAAVFAVASCIPIFDLTGFDHFLPTADRVKSVSFYPYAINDYSVQRYYNNDPYGREIELSEDETIEAALKIAAAGIDAIDREEERHSGVPIEANVDQTSFCMQYHLYSGRNPARQYQNIDFNQVKEAFLTIATSEEYKLQHYPILTKSPVHIDNLRNIYQTDYYYKDSLFYNNRLSDAEERQLLEAFCSDLLELSEQTLQTELPVMLIDVRLYPDEKEAIRDDGNYGIETYPIYESFHRTIALLKALGYYDTVQPDIKQIERMYVSQDYYDSSVYTDEEIKAVEERGGVGEMEITDPLQMEEILRSAYSPRSFGLNQFVPEEELVTIRLEYSSDADESYQDYTTTLRFRRGELPAFLKSQIGYDKLAQVYYH